MGKAIAGKVTYVAMCLLAAVLVVVASYAHKVVGEVTATEKGIPISGSPTVGAMNILVMGLESRTNYQGQELPPDLLAAMHSGSVGGQDTNTLILIHVFAGGQKAVGISIPRDDLVTYPQSYYPGVTEGKIDQAYDYAYTNYINQHASLPTAQLYLGANDAGQAATIATVEAVTGVHIDHFAEVNLAGFYYLAQAFGGIEVCIKPENGGQNLTDANSGFNAVADGYNPTAGGAQYLHLGAAQALAFVRERDNLLNGDLDRTHRQQAVLDYVIYELKQEGAVSDLGKIPSLLSTMSEYLITDSTFNLIDFATSMSALSGSNMTFLTAPIATTQNGLELNGYSQDVNIINVPYVQQYVQNAFYPPAPAPKSSESAAAKKAATTPPNSDFTVDVYNGSYTNGLAADVSAALVGLGFKPGAVADASDQAQSVAPGTQVFYGAGAAANAAQVATQFGAVAQSLTSLPAGHVEVLLGTTATQVPDALASASAAATQSANAAPAAGDGSTSPDSTATSSANNNGQSGGPITVAPDAKYGIPCVY